MDLILQNWTNDDYVDLLNYLISESDTAYRAFNEKVLNTTDETLGVRTPVIRKIAKQIIKGNPVDFISGCKPKYHEEKLLLGIVIAETPVPYAQFIKMFDDFLPLISSWGICDMLCSSIKKPIKNNKQEYFKHIQNYLDSKNPLIIRVGIVSMLSCYMDMEHLDDCLMRIEKINSQEYYVKIANAWFISVVMAKFPDYAKAYLNSCNIDNWTFNKAIQKSIESRRVSAEDKALLRSLKRK